MKQLPLFIVFFVVISSCTTYSSIKHPLQKKLDSGIIEGILSEDGEVEIYLGIPYARPPVGELRWKAPQMPLPWRGVLKTQKFANIAMQYRFEPWVHFDESRLSEDCLYLNVWKPTRVADKKLPVLVNIHGGGLVAGEGSELRLDGANMAKKGMIVVTINYRLNIFGFLAHPELSAEVPQGASGNYGYMDQQFALQWVKNNIEAFGGDPNRITVAGESAGAWSVLALMVSPLSKELIAGAIGSSGGILPLQSLKEAEKKGEQTAKRGGFKTLADMRRASTAEIMEVYKQMDAYNYLPVLDHYVFTKNSIETYMAGEQANIPLLIGWNSAELPPEAYLRGLNYSKEHFVAITKELYPRHSAEVLHMFAHSTEDEIKHSAAALASIPFIVQGAWKWFDLHRNHGKQPVYRYLFSKVHPPQKIDSLDIVPYQTPLGAQHAEEIAYSWGNLALMKEYNFMDDDKNVSAIMQEYFSNFIKTGNPNGNQLPEWPAINPKNPLPLMMNFDTKSQLVPAAFDYQIQFFVEAGYPYW